MTGIPSFSHLRSFSGPGLLPASKNAVFALTDDPALPPCATINSFI